MIERDFKCILSFIQFALILLLFISFYWLLDMYMSHSTFVNARLYLAYAPENWKCMNQKPSQQILYREFKYILNTNYFGWILDLSIPIYWLLLTQISQAAFLSARLSTSDICINNEVITMNIIPSMSEKFLKRLIVIMNPRSYPGL